MVIESTDFGALRQHVQDIDTRMERMERKVDTLIEAHQSQIGMARMGAIVVTGVSGLVGWLVGHWHLLTGKGL